MQVPRTPATAAGLLLLLASASPLSAQQQAPPALPDSIREMVMEFQTLQGHVDSVQTEALETHPELQTAQEELRVSVTRVMIEEEPELEAKIDSLPRLQQAFTAAQQANDTTEMRSIVQAGQRIQGQVQRARAEALASEAVQDELQAFEDQMMAAMEEVDPDVGEMLDRMEAISARLQAFQEGG